MFNLFNKKKAAKMVEYKEVGKTNEIQECVTSASDFKISSKYILWFNLSIKYTMVY